MLRSPARRASASSSAGVRLMSSAPPFKSEPSHRGNVKGRLGSTQPVGSNRTWCSERFATNGLCTLVFPEAEERGVTQVAVGGPLDEADLRDQRRLQPLHLR